MLKAAGAGATVATLAGREGLSPFSAMAHVDTKSACTAQDIDVSDGIVTIEPCERRPGASSPQCFTINNPTSGTYSLTVADSRGCARTATVSVLVAQITGGLTHETPGCNGQVVFSATPDTGCTYEWKVDGITQSETGAAFTYTPIVDGANHTVSVQARCGGCVAPGVSETLSRSVTTTFS